MKQERGRFITFEGIEGCGKTTQIKRLATWLHAQKTPFIQTKQPGGTAIGQGIRKVLLHQDSKAMVPACEALLYLADRAQHHAEVIEPTLSKGTWVLCDRYQDSTMAYQGAARGLDPAELDRIFRLVTDNLQPDLTLLLDLDPEVGLTRARRRLQDQDMTREEGRFEEEHLDFHRAVRRSFLQFAETQSRWAKVDAARTPDQVADDIRDIVQGRGYV